MKFAINEAVKLAMRYLLGPWPLCQWPLRQILTEVASIYPNNVVVHQDRTPEAYLTPLEKIMFFELSEEIKTRPEYLEWQLRQLYRMLNAIISSKYRAIDACKMNLMRLRAEVENSEQVKSWLKDLADSKSLRELVCVGHGAFYLEDGPAKELAGCQIVLYSPMGSPLCTSFASAIESSTYNPQSVYIIDDKKEISFIPTVYNFPKIYSESTIEKVPDFTLVTQGKFNARIIEKATGRVVLEIPDQMKLSAIAKEFPGSILHWSACQVIRLRNSKLDCLGPNASFYAMHENAMFPKPKIHEGSLRRFRRNTYKLKFNSEFKLFSQKRSRTPSVNEEIVEEIKRKKMNPK